MPTPPDPISTSTLQFPLLLEYRCTPEEQSETKTLAIRQHYGGGSKHLTWILLCLILALVLFEFAAMIKQMLAMPPLEGGLLFAAIVGFTLFAYFRNRRKPKSAADSPPNKLQLTPEALQIGIGEVQSIIPWNTFSKTIESDNLFLLIDRTQTTVYIIPKRVLPSPDWIPWLRDVTSQTTGVPAADPAPSDPPPSQAIVSVHYQLKFRHCLDYAAVSWHTRGACLFQIGVILYSFAATSMKPTPHAVNSNMQTFFFFGIPWMLIGTLFMWFLFAVHSWWLHRKHFIPTTIDFYSDGLVESTKDSSTKLPWTTYTRFRETRLSFLIWNHSNRLWLVIPKSSFDSEPSAQLLRQLLQQHLVRSIWFYSI